MSDAPAFFYEGGGRRDAIDALFEGIHRDDAVMLLVGPGGAGRTALLDRFCVEVDPDVLAVAMATGDILMSADQCFFALAADIDARDAGGEPASTDARTALLVALSAVRESGRMPVIVIDDAHELGEDTREGILAVCRDASVPVVLAGDETLPSLLGDEPRCVAVTLRAFTEEETEDFVSAWLAVGAEDELPSHRAMARLHKQAGGLPGRLVDLLDSGATTRTALLPAGFPVWHLAFTVVAVALLLWLLSRTEPVPAVPKAVAVAEIPVELPAPDKVGAVGNTGVVPETHFPTVAVPQPIVAAATSPEEPAGGAADAVPAAADKPAPAARSTDHVAAPANSTLPVHAASAREPVPVPAPVREPQKVVRKFTADEDALLKEKASRFTLQVFASFNEDAVRQFRSRHAGLAVRTYRTSREDLSWYVAVIGVHRSKDEAKTTIAKLPADIQKLKPWPRTLGGIQDELRRRKD